MSKRVIKTGLSKKYKDMLDAVIGQMSDGYWENTPMMRGYWKFVTTGTSGDEVTLEVDEMSGARDGDRRVENRFYGMSDDAVKKFFADKIKFLIKEEGLGKWARDNEETTDYLSYSDPYRVKDCYYAYEVLKGRDARKHAEYGDVEESRQQVKIKLVERAKNAANESGEELYNVFLDGDVWAENVSKEKANAIVNSYDGEKDCWMEKADANESFDGWDGWEEIEGLESALDGIEDLAYELRSCVRGAKTGCKDWTALSRHIQNLAAKLDDAAGEMAYKRDDGNESKRV